MSICCKENDSFCSLRIWKYFINEYPVSFNMAVPCALPFSMKRMIFMIWQKRNFFGEHLHYCIEF